MSYGLPRFCRLHLKNDFKAVIQGGIKLQQRGVALWVRPGPDTNGPVRFAVVVSKKLGMAVQRNRAKRLLREAFRYNREKIKLGTDLVVSPRSGENLTNAQQAREVFSALCAKVGLIDSSSDKMR